MKRFYEYDVEWYNEDYQPERNRGLVIAENFYSAVDIVEGSFDSVKSIKVTAINDDHMLDYDHLTEYLKMQSKEGDIGDGAGPQVIAALEKIAKTLQEE